MEFLINSEIEYEVFSPSTLIFNIHALSTQSQIVLEESLFVDPNLKIEEFKSSNSTSRFVRLEINQPMNFKISYRAKVDTHYKLVDQQKETESISVLHLDGDIIPFLFPSRYCQSDKLQRLAYNEFGRIENVYSKVLAITNWIYNNVEYLSGSTNSQTSAYDTITERAGVCRDFAHLGIALCRALSIPARYFTGYAFKLYPPDFHACFEAYIGGSWIIFDPTRLAPLNGMVKIATGRDAADAAVASIFGNVQCTYINVECDTVEPGFVPFVYENTFLQGLSYR
jgi:transglutaminase-like putative cysteine protease